MARHNELGAWGEQLARNHLLGLGFAINDENARAGGVEIDLVALRGTEVHFVEVKTRSTGFADPLDAVDRRKRSRMVRAADAWMRAQPLPLTPYFDIILIIGTPEEGHTLEYIPDAFFPGMM